MFILSKKQTASRLSMLLPALAALVPLAQAQNVGIGTAAPASKLTVNGNLGVGAGAPWTTTAAPAGGALIQGDVGIGTTTPTAKLDVEAGVLELSQGFALRWGSNDGVERIYSASGGLGGVSGNNLYLESREHMFFISDTNNTTPNSLVGFIWATNASPELGSPSELMRLTNAGNLGIGDTTPNEAKLVVRGGVTGTSEGPGQRLNPTSGVVPAQDQSGWVSIFAANQIWAVGNIVTQNNLIATNTLTPSDSRLKNILGVSDAAADLETLGKIRVTDYTLKDTAAARGTIKKVVAQQVEEVYPPAISKSTGWLPDIQAFGAAKAREKGVFEISMERPHDLATGAKLKIIVANGEAEFATVQSVTENTFTAKLGQTADGDRVFVYGRQTDDLRAVNYDALSMLNISATQELARRLQTERAEIAALKAQLSSLKAQNDRLAALTERMESLEKIVRVQSADKEAGTPVLAR